MQPRTLTDLSKEDLAKSLEHTSYLTGRLEVCVCNQVRNKMRLPYDLLLKSAIWDFPDGPVGKTLSSQCRGPGFDPWPGN